MSNERRPGDLFQAKDPFEKADYLHFYSDFLDGERADKDVRFLVDALKLDRPMRILDLACGHGRHTIRLAELGHQVTGVDITKPFLDLAEKTAAEKGLEVEFIHQDMRDISFVEQFDRAFIFFTAFGYFEEGDNLEVLKRVARALKPGGLMCLDTVNRDMFVKGKLPAVLTERGPDMQIDHVNELDPLTGQVHTRRTVFKDGKRTDVDFKIRIYNATELKAILAQAGLKIRDYYGDWDTSKPFAADSWRLVAVAKR